MNAPHTYLFGPLDQGCQCETCKRERLNEAAPALLNALHDMIEYSEPPERNCSCHTNPPCGDCVDYGGLRESIERAKAAIAKAGQS